MYGKVILANYEGKKMFKVAALSLDAFHSSSPDILNSLSSLIFQSSSRNGLNTLPDILDAIELLVLLLP